MKHLLVAALLCSAFASCKKTSTDPQTFSTLNLQPSHADDVNVFAYSSNEGDPDTFQLAKYNYYGNTILYMNQWQTFEPATAAKSFIKFGSISSLPSTAKILSAKLYLYGVDSLDWVQGIMAPVAETEGNSFYIGVSDSLAHAIYLTDADSAFGNTVVLQKITSGWDPHSITFNSIPASGDTVGIIAASTSKWNYNAVVDLTNLVQEWVQNPTSNFGISLSISLADRNTYMNRQMVFYSSFASDSLKRPQLIIQYQ